MTIQLMARVACSLVLLSGPAYAQLVDNTLAPNLARSGINKSLAQEIGPGRGDLLTRDSSVFMIHRDPFRSIRRGRQLFQRKFTVADGVGPISGDGGGDVMSDGGIGAACQTVAPPVMADREVPQGLAGMWPPGRTAVTRLTCSGWGCGRCWRMR